ncbi:hypothetical protein INT45_002406 [Circinella minor]|uniref:Uncharacterized protein n=1 Tax=Circinella minor TaxID=1195481 RepID=A0A8H7RWF1_9FUNG|nr:hypothetical protein INT45_002406 [Circinella minor]
MPFDFDFTVQATTTTPSRRCKNWAGTVLDDLQPSLHMLLEAISTKDNTKEFEDSMLKRPFVFKDTLDEIASCRPSLIHKPHVFDYNISDADIPGGHIVKIRQTDELEYPSDNNDYVLKIVSLLELASYGKAIINDTYFFMLSNPGPAIGNW